MTNGFDVISDDNDESEGGNDYGGDDGDAAADEAFIAMMMVLMTTKCCTLEKEYALSIQQKEEIIQFLEVERQIANEYIHELLQKNKALQSKVEKMASPAKEGKQVSRSGRQEVGEVCSIPPRSEALLEGPTTSGSGGQPKASVADEVEAGCLNTKFCAAEPVSVIAVNHDEAAACCADGISRGEAGENTGEQSGRVVSQGRDGKEQSVSRVREAESDKKCVEKVGRLEKALARSSSRVDDLSLRMHDLILELSAESRRLWATGRPDNEAEECSSSWRSSVDQQISCLELAVQDMVLELTVEAREWDLNEKGEQWDGRVDAEPDLHWRSSRERVSRGRGYEGVQAEGQVPVHVAAVGNGDKVEWKQKPSWSLGGGRERRGLAEGKELHVEAQVQRIDSPSAAAAPSGSSRITPNGGHMRPSLDSFDLPGRKRERRSLSIAQPLGKHIHSALDGKQLDLTASWKPTGDDAGSRKPPISNYPDGRLLFTKTGKRMLAIVEDPVEQVALPSGHELAPGRAAAIPLRVLNEIKTGGNQCLKNGPELATASPGDRGSPLKGGVLEGQPLRKSPRKNSSPDVKRHLQNRLPSSRRKTTATMEERQAADLVGGDLVFGQSPRRGGRRLENQADSASFDDRARALQPRLTRAGRPCFHSALQSLSLKIGGMSEKIKRLDLGRFGITEDGMMTRREEKVGN
ncbi:hypothetical protein CBR_g30762 [Chara braunii]|uniref:Uncharacterized protein n=1 Tax=Chara braunii TaxID=69332 RepID=A0A388JXH6_CHABU|nr:hypothetical protein CBR_g30762 [Chara braunii]|eukprot:GBG62442.1 hypothetical protein CBR_g30762 [Chara braunii]